MLRWYAVYSKASREEDAAQGVGEQRFRTALPLISYERKRSRRIETIIAPMFRRFFFAEFDISIEGWQAIAHTKHVCGILPPGRNPEPVRNGWVEQIMAAQEANGGAIPEEKPIIVPFEEGQEVKFVFGPYTGFRALVKLDEGERVRVLLDMFGRSHVIPVERESIARG